MSPDGLHTLLGTLIDNWESGSSSSSKAGKDYDPGIGEVLAALASGRTSAADARLVGVRHR